MAPAAAVDVVRVVGSEIPKVTRKRRVAVGKTVKAARAAVPEMMTIIGTGIARVDAAKAAGSVTREGMPKPPAAVGKTVASSSSRRLFRAGGGFFARFARHGSSGAMPASVGVGLTT